MINKRLMSIVPESIRYIWGNVISQWISLIANIVMMICITGFISNLYYGKADRGDFAWMAIVAVSAIIVRIVCSYVSSCMSYLSSKKVKETLREKIYEKLLCLGSSYKEKVNTSEIVQVAVEGVDQLDTYFGAYLPQFFYAMLAPITLFIVMSFVSVTCAVVLLICVPLIPVSIVFVQKFAKKLLAKYWGKYTTLTVLHQSERRIRIKTPKLYMTYHQADALEYYLKSKDEIKDAAVDERTGNATIVFHQSNLDKKHLLRNYLDLYDENSNEVSALIPEETGRKLNREYQEKLVLKILKRGVMKFVVPAPVRMVRTMARGVPYVCKALRTLPSGKMKIELLDGIAIATSILREDYSTASSIMFLLETGEVLEEWTKKKSIGDLARTMSLNVEKVWVKSE